MRPLIIIALFILPGGCDPGDPDKKSKITIGDYSFEIPSGYTLKPEKAFNSKQGRIQADGFTLSYEFSSHTEPPVLTPQEYIDSEKWQPAVAFDLFQQGLKDVHKIRFLSTRPAGVKDSATCKGCDYIVNGRYNSLEFEAPIYLPGEIKQSRFLMDTVDNVQRKIFLAKDPGKGRTGIYLKRLTPEALQTNNIYALSIFTRSLTKAQQDKLVKLFLTAQYVPSK